MVFEHAKDSEALTCLNCCNSVTAVAFEWCFCTSKRNRRVEFHPLSLPGEDCYSYAVFTSVAPDLEKQNGEASCFTSTMRVRAMSWNSNASPTIIVSSMKFRLKERWDEVRGQGAHCQTRIQQFLLKCRELAPYVAHPCGNNVVKNKWIDGCNLLQGSWTQLLLRLCHTESSEQNSVSDQLGFHRVKLAYSGLTH